SMTSQTISYLLISYATAPPPRSTLFPYTTLFRSSLPGERKSALATKAESRIYPGPGLQIPAMAVRGTSPPRARPTRPSTTTEARSEEHTSELQSLAYLVCRLLLEKKKETKSPNRI